MKILKLFMILGVFLIVCTSCEKENYTATETDLVNKELNSQDTDLKSSGIDQEIRLDYHEEYGTIRAKDYPMRPLETKVTLETFLKKANINREDLVEYEINEERFTGIGLAEHLIRGEVVQVYHRYENEPIQSFKAITKDGETHYIVLVLVCSNGLTIVVHVY